MLSKQASFFLLSIITFSIINGAKPPTPLHIDCDSDFEDGDGFTIIKPTLIRQEHVAGINHPAPAFEGKPIKLSALPSQNNSKSQNEASPKAQTGQAVPATAASFDVISPTQITPTLSLNTPAHAEQPSAQPIACVPDTSPSPTPTLIVPPQSQTPNNQSLQAHMRSETHQPPTPSSVSIVSTSKSTPTLPTAPAIPVAVHYSACVESNAPQQVPVEPLEALSASVLLQAQQSLAVIPPIAPTAASFQLAFQMMRPLPAVPASAPVAADRPMQLQNVPKPQRKNSSGDLQIAIAPQSPQKRVVIDTQGESTNSYCPRCCPTNCCVIL